MARFGVVRIIRKGSLTRSSHAALSVTFLREALIKILDSGVVLAGGTAFLYSASTAYTHGYLYVLNLDSDILDRNFHQILYHGMILNIWTMLLFPLAVAVIVTLHSGYKVELSNYILNSVENGRRVARLRKKILGKKKKNRSVETKYYDRIRKVWFFVAMSVAFFLGMAKFESQGKAVAEQTISRIEEGGFSQVNLSSQKLGDGHAYLYCGARNCAALNIKTKEIVYFPQSGHRYVKSEKN